MNKEDYMEYQEFLNKEAPDFIGITDEGKTVKLSDFRGKYVVLYFYPKDNTPGCTKEACNFRDNMDIISSTDTVVIGVSTDSENSHKKFKQKFNLNFTLISDKDKNISKLYNTLSITGTSKRITFLIDKNGIIKYVWDKVNVNNHAQEVLEKIKEIQTK